MELPVKELFVKFIQNQCSNDDKARVLAYINAGGYEDEWEAAIQQTEHLAHSETQSPAFNQALLYSKIKLATGLKPKKSGTVRWVAYAASVLIAGLAGFYMLQPKTKATPAKISTSVAKNNPLQSGRKWVKLADGTSVLLNSNSHLDYPDNFKGKKTREVTLLGEAFFDVKHDAIHPFIIHTGKIKTTVLGTAFNIYAYKANTRVTVTVTRGKVIVQDEHKTLAVLTPNQQLLWTPNTQTPNTQQVDASAVTAWKASDLIMDDITLAQAAEMIAQRYGVQVIFKNEKVKHCKFTAAFLNRNSIDQVLSVLSDITGAHLNLTNGYITVDGPGC